MYMLVLKLLGSFFLGNWIIGSWVATWRRLRLAADGDILRPIELLASVFLAIAMSALAIFFLCLIW